MVVGRAGARRAGLSALALLALLLPACRREQPAAEPSASPRAAEAPIPSPIPPDGPRPNVVVVLIDTLRADRLSAHGYGRETSPAIDRLAAAGVDFRAAFAPATWTKPSIASLFTGLHPTEHGLMHLGEASGDSVTTDALPRSLPTLAQAFREGGWATVGVVNQVHLQPQLGFARGFDDYLWRRGKRAPELNTMFGDWLDHWVAGGDERPFFAYIHYLDVHWPYEERPGDLPADRFGSITFENPPPRGLARVAEWAAEAMTPSDLEVLSTRYDNEIAWIDRAIGDLVARLEAVGRYEETIVVVTSDHGEGFYEHGMLKHGYAPYDEVAQVPLIIRLPARWPVPAGPRSTVVSLVDLPATLLELVGLPPLAGSTGRSLVPILRGVEDPERRVLIQSEEGWALRTAGAKLIARPERLEFYDLAADPGERENLAAASCTGPCADLRAELRRLRSTLRSPPADAGETGKLSGEDVHELESLGYL